MRVFHIAADRCHELDGWPQALPATGFVWIGSARREFEVQLAPLQAALQGWGLGAIVDLHASDLLNLQLPSHFESTSWYELMVFRRLAAGAGSNDLFVDDSHGTLASAGRALQAIDTSPVGFVAYDRLLITVHPTDCAVREHFAQRLAAGGPRLPAGPADLMLRMVNHMVDSYLDLRRLLTRHLGTLQRELLDPRSRFDDWKMLLDARNALHLLEDTCEDQRAALQEWLDALGEQPPAADKALRREHELMQLRARDVLEHIERVLTHVRRLEHSAEAAVQMHFAALGQRTNDVMRTLTVLTAIFLPLNLITGFFGMNFDEMPLIHSSAGIWATALAMVGVGVGLIAYFRRKRYLDSTGRP
jgi:Mg2+ and Co2+ transporter CorA